MRKFIYILIISIIVLGTLWSPVRISAQDFSQDRKITRQEKKESRKAELYENYKAIAELLDKKTFVLEADFLQDGYGGEVPVTSALNFIMVNGPTAILQTGNDYYAGYNGVGGVTAEGTLSNWKVIKDDKKMYYTVSFTTTTNVGTYDISMTIDASATARATIRGFTRGSLTYRGNLVATYNSKVYKGQRSL